MLTLHDGPGWPSGASAATAAHVRLTRVRHAARMLIACAAHWYVSLLFPAPVAAVAGAMRWSTWRADREEALGADRRAGELIAADAA